ncbi:MAG: hypothetical protein R3E66_09580 [bacterium]
MVERSRITSGPPRFTAGGREILSFHLHRFLAAWMAQIRVPRVYVAVGFHGSSMPRGLIEVTHNGAAFVEKPWGFDDAVAAWSAGGHWLNVEGEENSLTLVPLTELAYGGDDVTLGFAMVGAELNTAQLEELRTHATSAIQACRRNAVRLYFDETPLHDIKGFIYGLLDHVPEWTGCDGSAAVILSNSLDAMRLSSLDANFYVMAERLYGPSDDRLVGMGLRAEAGTLLGEALAGARSTTKRSFQRFIRQDDGVWEGVNVHHDPFHVAGRDERMLVLVPLVVVEGDEREHLGWLALSWQKVVEMPTSTAECLSVLADRLAEALRHSPLYTLSARKMWILKAVRTACERAISASGDQHSRRIQLVHDVTALVKAHTGVPSFALGHVVPKTSQRPRILRFDVSYGWSAFEAIDLPVDVEDSIDSGVSTLAVRLRTSMVLAGRHGTTGFKNYLYVDESTRRLVDSRTPEGAQAVASDGHWRRLSDYYKPARDQAYATLAHPVVFDGVVLGVIALEVDRETPWYWWSGYGGQLFWELMAGDLAFAFKALGLDETKLDA